jgi:hypothetical protein
VIPYRRWRLHQLICISTTEVEDRHRTSHGERKWDQELLANTREFNCEHDSRERHFHGSRQERGTSDDGEVSQG